MHTISYPQYRKYRNGQAYFKIISATEWEEVRVMGNKTLLYQFNAQIMPDRNYIYDMTFAYEDSWLKIEGDEYELQRKKAVLN